MGSSEAREAKSQLEEVGSDTSDNDNITSQNWLPTVGLTGIALSVLR